jgi:hypothetical protein
MEDNLKHLELIEAYLEGNLSEEEKVDFEVRLLVDKDLEEEFELYKKIVGGFKDIQTENIRQKLQAIDDEIDSNSHKPSTKFYWWAGLAACLIFVQILIILFLFQFVLSFINKILRTLFTLFFCDFCHWFLKFNFIIILLSLLSF